MTPALARFAVVALASVVFIGPATGAGTNEPSIAAANKIVRDWAVRDLERKQANAKPGGPAYQGYKIGRVKSHWARIRSSVAIASSEVTILVPAIFRPGTYNYEVWLAELVWYRQSGRTVVEWCAGGTCP